MKTSRAGEEGGLLTAGSRQVADLCEPPPPQAYGNAEPGLARRSGWLRWFVPHRIDLRVCAPYSRVRVRG